MSTRRRAREIVLQLLYEADLGGTRDADGAKKFIKSRLQGRKGLSEFSQRLLEGTLKHQVEIDRRLTKLSTHWTLPRMPATDRNVLRLGCYEIMFGGTPGQVAVSEAISLAKRYGDRNSQRFVNGVLDRLYKEEMSKSKAANHPATSDSAASDSAASDSSQGEATKPASTPGLSTSAKRP